MKRLTGSNIEEEFHTFQEQKVRPFKRTLITKLWSYILLELFIRLSKVVFQQIEKDRVVFLGHSRIFHDECAILDESFSGSNRSYNVQSD